MSNETGVVKQSLSDMCRRKMFTPITAASVVYKLAFALKLLHKSGITHGHLKTDEIEVYVASSSVSYLCITHDKLFFLSL